MTRRPLVLIAVAGLVAVGLMLVGWLQDGVRRVLMLTSVDPGVLGRVASPSTEPVDLTLVARLAADGNSTYPEHPAAARAAITFRVPAAFLWAVSLGRKPDGNQSITFSVWRDSFTPYQPDRIAFRLRREGKGIDPNASLQAGEEDPYIDRLRAGDGEVQFEIGNHFGSAARRAENLLSLAEASGRSFSGKPCEVDQTEAEGMTVIRPTERPSERSCFPGSEGGNAENFLKMSPGGRPVFAVRCAGGDPRGRPGPPFCQMSSYFAEWGILVWVRNRHPAEWGPLLDRINGFLTQHLVSNDVEQLRNR